MSFRSCRLAAVMFLATSACGSDSAPSASSAPSGSAAPRVASAARSAAPAAKPVELDAETQRLVKAAAEKCKTNDVTESVDACPAGEYEAIGKYAQDKKPKNFHVTLAEMALTDGAKDKKIYAVAMNCLGNFAESGGRDWLKAGATPEAAERTLKLLGDAPKEYGSYLARAAMIPLAAGKIDETTAALKGAKSGALRTGGFNYYLRYAGIAALPAVQAIAKDAALKPGERASAVQSVAMAVSPGVFGTDPVLPDPDKAKACDWAKELTSDATPEVATAALDALGDCKGAYIDAALLALESRVDKEKPSNALITAAFHQCWAHGVVGRAPNGSPDQCKKALELVDKLTQKPDLIPSDLSWAVSVAGFIGESSPDSRAKAKEILARYKGHKEKMVADSATRGLEKLDKLK